MVHASTSAKPDQLAPLTSLRFVTALMIFMHHAPPFMPELGIKWVPMTFVQSVSFFFVLSGFILTHVYINRPSISFRRFMFGRFAKIWPLHVFTLCVVLLSFPVNQTAVASAFAQFQILTLNVFMLHSVVPVQAIALSGNGPAWSISTEVYFYAAFPFLLAGIRQNWAIKLAISAALASYVALVGHHSGLHVAAAVHEPGLGMLIYTNPLVRGFEFCFGMAAWVLWDKYIRRMDGARLLWTIIECAVVAIAVFWLAAGLKLVNSLLPINGFSFWFFSSGGFWLFGLIIVVFANGRGYLGAALNWRPIVYLGETSFAFYLVHIIILRALAIHFRGEIPSIWVVLVLTAFVAILCHELIEKPAQRALLAFPTKHAGLLARLGKQRMAAPAE